MNRFLRVLLLICPLCFTVQVRAQVPTGTPAFGSFSEGPDVINLANLNSHLTIPVLHKAGRGVNFSYDLTYDSSVWYRVGSTWHPVVNFGWSGRMSEF